MARTELPNGIILPAEYSDDWYDDMTSNLSKLDEVIGSDADKLSAEDVGAAALSNDYDDLDNKPSIPTKTSDLTNDSNFVVSSSLATVATSGDYDDLSNKPTINDSTITIQKNGSTVDTFTTNGSAKTINIPVPTKTSDLTNDSNFVDTSNSAVASGITSAKVTSYDSHIADTDIHVTTADKIKWNNGVSQSYAFRYSSTALVASSTNSNTLLDNTDNLKVGDKVIDSSGVLFSITAIDTANSTFTIGTALIDLAQDSDVVHKSGENENVSGNKTFTWPIAITSYPCIRMYLSDDEWNVQPASAKQSEIRFTDRNAVLISYITFQHRTDANEPFRTCWRQQKMDGTSSYFSVNFNNLGEFYPENGNAINLGTSSRRWKAVYANQINGLEPSALSLPSGNLNDVIDISGYLTYLEGTANTYTAPANGWISITMNGCSGIQAYINGLWGNQIVRPSVGAVRFLMPITKNLTANILIFGGTIDNARFIPCQGNV